MVYEIIPIYILGSFFIPHLYLKQPEGLFDHCSPDRFDVVRQIPGPHWICVKRFLSGDCMDIFVQGSIKKISLKNISPKKGEVVSENGFCFTFGCLAFLRKIYQFDPIGSCQFGMQRAAF